jgi:hypothetical protein
MLIQANRNKQNNRISRALTLRGKGAFRAQQWHLRGCTYDIVDRFRGDLRGPQTRRWRSELYHQWRRIHDNRDRCCSITVGLRCQWCNAGEVWSNRYLLCSPSYLFSRLPMPWDTVQRLSSCVLPDAADGDGAHRQAAHPAINAANPLLLPAPIGPLPPSSPALQPPPQKRIIDRDRGGDSFMVIPG